MTSNCFHPCVVRYQILYRQPVSAAQLPSFQQSDDFFIMYTLQRLSINYSPYSITSNECLKNMGLQTESANTEIYFIT